MEVVLEGYESRENLVDAGVCEKKDDANEDADADDDDEKQKD
jgi:hypothetical protein